MDTARKITVEVPPELLEKAQRASGSGITQTVRTGLQLVAASQAYARLRQLRGKVRFTRTSAESESRPMIAVDTSTWIAFLQGDGGEDAELLDKALQDRQVLMVPAVLTEVLSDPKLPSEVSETLAELPLIEITARLLATGRRIASEGARKAPQSAPRRCPDRPELYR